MKPHRLLAGMLIFTGCASGSTENPPPETLDAFLAEVETELQANLDQLDEGDRAQLADLFPVMKSETTWRGVLDVLEERPALVPLANRTAQFISRRAAGQVRLELNSAAGDNAVRDLLVNTIGMWLAT